MFDEIDNFHNKIINAAGIFGQAILSFQDFVSNIDFEKLLTALEALERLPEILEEVQLFLLSRGWYCINELELSKFTSVMDKDDEVIEQIMIEFIGQRQEKIMDSITAIFPNRKQIIDDAFDAHKRELYTLSIPVLLCQIDGISRELFNVDFFGKRNSKMKTTSIYELLIDKIDFDKGYKEKSFLKPLTTPSSVNLNTDILVKMRLNDQYFGPLNRHEVIHGVSTEYSNVGNSMRCIMLMDFIQTIKKNYIDDFSQLNNT